MRLSKIAYAPIAVKNTPRDDGWQPPSDWPDIRAALAAYPEGATAQEVNAAAVMFDMFSADRITVKGGLLSGSAIAPTQLRQRRTKTFSSITLSLTAPAMDG